MIFARTYNSEIIYVPWRLLNLNIHEIQIFIYLLKDETHYQHVFQLRNELYQ